jgi:hypothetical protein
MTGLPQPHHRWLARRSELWFVLRVVLPLVQPRMEDSMCWEIDYQFWAEQRKAQEAKAKEEQRTRVLDQVLTEANKQAEKAKVKGMPVEEVTAK